MVHVVQNSSQDWKDEKAKKTATVLRQLEGGSKEQEASRYAASVGLPYLDLNIFPADPGEVTVISEEDSRKFRIAFFDKTKKVVRVAFADPEDVEATGFVEKLAEAHDWTIEPYVVSMQSLEKVWNTYKKTPFLH